jgi:hypothetical protein
VHGLVNRAIQSFLKDNYGRELWDETVDLAETGLDDFDTMQVYDDEITAAVISAASRVLRKPRSLLLEDIGSYLVSGERMQAVRRLLRFGGLDFTEFLYSLADLPGRARMAVPDIGLPEMDLRENGDHSYVLTCVHPVEGFGHVLLGLLQALADDYGTLALIEHVGRQGQTDTLSVRLVETDYAEAKDFALISARR